MASNKPLFSRRQLNLIIAATAIVIALLSIPTQTWPTIERQQWQATIPLTSITDPNLPPQLRLLFALPQPGLLPDEPAQVLMQLLQPRLATGSIQPTLHSDRISLAISADSPDQLSRQLDRLGPLLLQPLDPAAIGHAIKQRRAQQHINRNRQQPLHQTDRWLRQQQTPPITAASINQLQQQLLSRQQLQISLTGLTAQSIAAPLNHLLEQLPAGQPWPAVQTAGATTQASAPKQTTDARDISQSAAAALLLPGRQSTDFPQTLLLSRLIDQLIQPSVRFYPGALTSWLIGLPPKSDPDPNWLNTELQQAQQQLVEMEDWELERAADDLRQQLEQRLRQPDTLSDQLEVIAFYHLPIDYLPQFDATIAALTGAQIRQQLQRLLQPERFRYATAPQ